MELESGPRKACSSGTGSPTCSSALTGARDRSLVSALQNLRTWGSFQNIVAFKAKLTLLNCRRLFSGVASLTPGIEMPTSSHVVMANTSYICIMSANGGHQGIPLTMLEDSYTHGCPGKLTSNAIKLSQRQSTRLNKPQSSKKTGGIPNSPAMTPWNLWNPP